MSIFRRTFPFKFGRQPRAAPVRKSVGFEITDVRDRFVWIDRAKSGESEIPPFAVALHPVKRRLPPPVAVRSPSSSLTKARIPDAIAAGLDELEIFAVGDRPIASENGRRARDDAGLRCRRKIRRRRDRSRRRFVKLDELQTVPSRSLPRRGAPSRKTGWSGFCAKTCLISVTSSS